MQKRGAYQQWKLLIWAALPKTCARSFPQRSKVKQKHL